MAETGTSKTNVRGMPLPIRNIGVIYCTSAQSAAGREFEKLADTDIIDVAHAIQEALQRRGFEAELIDLQAERIGELQRFDWIFNLAENIYGYPLTYDEVAQKMEEFNINFTGSGSKALRICTDKAATKCLLMLNEISTPAFEVFQPGMPIQNSLPFPLFVKPVNEDGSFGINDRSIVRSDDELVCQVLKIQQMYNQAALVEEYIEGRDITASVIGNGDQALVLPLSEINYCGDIPSKFLTFEAKWITESIEFQGAKACCPCDLPPQLDALIKKIALDAYHILGCSDFARVDFRVRDDRPYVLEVNPNPCLDPKDSGFIRSAIAAGFSYDDIVIKILSASVQDRAVIMNPSYQEMPNYLVKK